MGVQHGVSGAASNLKWQQEVIHLPAFQVHDHSNFFVQRMGLFPFRTKGELGCCGVDVLFLEMKRIGGNSESNEAQSRGVQECSIAMMKNRSSKLL